MIKNIRVENISKAYKTKSSWNQVLSDVSFEISPKDRIGILGRNGSGKSTLLRLIGGSEQPDSGKIIREMSVSWPVGFGGHLQPSMSGRANTKFCARIYDRDIDEVLRFVKDFSELGRYFEEPFRTYSSGMKARLGFALSMAISFDCLLIDEVTAVGDVAFREKCDRALENLSDDKAFILVNHAPRVIDRLCNRVIVLGIGPEPYHSPNVHATIKAYQRALKNEGWSPPD